MQEKKTTAFIWNILPFQERDLIFKALTETEGIASFFLRNGASKGNKTPLFPLSEIEIVFAPSKGELLKAKEISLLQGNLPLREKLPSLESAFFLIHSLEKILLPHKPAPLLFALFKSFLNRIPLSSNLPALEGAFLLKLLRHEGLWGLEGMKWDIEEALLFHTLAYTTKFDLIEKEEVSETTLERLKIFFLDSL